MISEIKPNATGTILDSLRTRAETTISPQPVESTIKDSGVRALYVKFAAVPRLTKEFRRAAQMLREGLHSWHGTPLPGHILETGHFAPGVNNNYSPPGVREVYFGTGAPDIDYYGGRNAVRDASAFAVPTERILSNPSKQPVPPRVIPLGDSGRGWTITPHPVGLQPKDTLVTNRNALPPAQQQAVRDRRLRTVSHEAFAEAKRLIPVRERPPVEATADPFHWLVPNQKSAAHAHDRIEERTDLHKSFIGVLQRAVDTLELPEGSYHVPLRAKDGTVFGYAQFKSVPNRTKPVLATVLSGTMKPGGRDLSGMLSKAAAFHEADTFPASTEWAPAQDRPTEQNLIRRTFNALSTGTGDAMETSSQGATGGANSFGGK